MATLYEQQQAQQQQKQQQQQIVGASVGAGVQEVGKLIGYKTNILATLTELIGGIGLGLSQFFTTKEQAAQREKQAQHQKVITDSIDQMFDKISQAGFDLIDKDLNPLTPDFETTLYQNLYQQIGYSGNCNATVWFPGSSPGPNRQIWFQVSNNGKILTPTPLLQDPPPNLPTYWSVKCSDVHDSWYSAYQNKLIAEGRTAELQAFRTALNKGRLIWQIAFGSIVTILVIVIFINMVRIK